MIFYALLLVIAVIWIFLFLRIIRRAVRRTDTLLDIQLPEESDEAREEKEFYGLIRKLWIDGLIMFVLLVAAIGIFVYVVTAE